MGKVQVFQLAPEIKSLMNSYVIKTRNDKIIVFDGGIDGEGLNKEPYIISAIRAILGLDEGDYFEVEAWFLTHQHRDHFNELRKALDCFDENSNYRIKNFYLDFPRPVVDWGHPEEGKLDFQLDFVDYLRKAMNRYFNIVGENKTFDEVNGSVVNAENIKKGLTIEVDGVFFDVLQTWSKNDNAINSNSIIVRMRSEGHSILFLGDCYIDSGLRLLETYGKDALKSEYVQLGHHGQSGPNKEFYDAINAKNSKRLWATPDWVWVRCVEWLRIHETRSWFGLPEEAKDYVESENDFVQGLYKVKVDDPTKVSSWTSEVLEEQKVGEW